MIMDAHMYFVISERQKNIQWGYSKITYKLMDENLMIWLKKQDN